MSFDEAADDRPRAAASAETYSLDRKAGLVIRRVRRRNGEFGVSSVLDAARGTRAPRDRFDRSWLRSPTTPPIGTGEAVTIVDLFAGCGGLSLGAAEACRALGARTEHVLAVELDEVAAAVFVKNFSGSDVRVRPIEDIVDGDVGETATARERKLSASLDEIDLLLAGPPCQGHSDLNNHSRRHDPKNALYLRALRFAEVVRPQHVVIENVPGVAYDRLGVVRRAAEVLMGAGYSVETAVLKADYFGVPQRRRRHVLVATRSSEPLMDDLRLLHSPRRPVMWAIDDLAGSENSDDVFDSPARHSPVNQRRIQYLFEHGIYDLPDAQRPDCHRLKPHTYRAVYGRMHPDLPAPTITAGFGSTGQGRFVHPLEPRTLTPHEAARVQGFPDFFDFSACRGRRALQQMIGNAVPPRLAYALAVMLLR